MYKGRHLTPVHLDFVVSDVGVEVERVKAAGGTLEGEIQEREWGRMANLAAESSG